MNKNKLVCHISFNHSPFDDRIYWKELLSLKQEGYGAVHIAVGEQYQDFIAKEGIRIITIKRHNPYKGLKKFVFISKALQAIFNKKGTINEILRVATSLKASVYHYHDLQINAISESLKKLAHKPTVIYDAHEAYHLMIKETLPKQIFQNILARAASFAIPKWEINKARYCDHIITTDLYTNAYFEKKLPCVPRTIIYNYSFFICPSKERKKKEYDFIYSGQLSRTRGIGEIIKAINRCKKTYPETTLLLIGGFDEKEFEVEVSNLITSLNLEKNITIKAWVPFSEIHLYYSSSQIGLCILHNTPKYSTAIPIKLFEYMAFNLPVISANHGPSAEIVKKENCGLLVDPDNIIDITTAMTKLLSNHVMRSEFGENGKQAIIRSYNWKVEKYKLLNLYDGFFN